MKRLQKYHTALLCALLVFFLFLGCGHPETSEKQSLPEAKSNPKITTGTIVAMGDSLTAGYNLGPEDAYPALLEKLLQQKGFSYRVVNAGISGETSSGALSRMQWVMTAKPDIIILETGANDGLRAIDPKITQANIEKIVTFFQEKKVTIVLAGMRMTPNLGQKFIEEFNQIYENVGQKYNLIRMPFFLEDVAAIPHLNLPDGIHPTKEGYRIVTRNLLPYVVKAINQREKEYVRE